jgi:nucleosome binding factor SPN SPT16 subunit
LLITSGRDLEKKEMADLVEQAELITIKGRRPPRLGDVYVRPALNAKKRLPGDLEIHVNGLRYVSPGRSEEKIG